jgi:hypothetical protein
MTEPRKPFRRSVRQDLPDGPPKITAAALVRYARLAWKQAKATKCTDAVAIIAEAPDMCRTRYPGVFSAGVSSTRGVAALAAAMIGNRLKGDETDDKRLVIARDALNDYTVNPPGVPRIDRSGRLE